jgi:hypothetical protein
VYRQKNSLIGEKACYRIKKNKKNRPGGGASWHPPRAGKKKHKKNLVQRADFRGFLTYGIQIKDI